MKRKTAYPRQKIIFEKSIPKFSLSSCQHLILSNLDKKFDNFLMKPSIHFFGWNKPCTVSTFR